MLARALVLSPSFLVADEPVSMLDVSVRAGILALLREVREAMGLTAVTVNTLSVNPELSRLTMAASALGQAGMSQSAAMAAEAASPSA